MALDPEEVGKRIAKARHDKGWTHAELAERVGEALGHRVNLRTVQRWQKGINPKNGKSWLPRLATLMTLADVFEVPSSYFVETDQLADADRMDHLELVARETLSLVREIRERLDGPEAPQAAATK